MIELIDKINDCLIIALSFLFFWRVVPFRRNKMIYKITAVLSCAAMITGYRLLMLYTQLYPIVCYILAVLVPMTVVFWILSLYRDTRFFMMIFTVASLINITSFFSAYFQKLFPIKVVPVSLMVTAVFYFLIFFVFRGAVEKQKKTLEISRGQLNIPAISCFSIFFVLVFCAEYPSPILERPQYCIQYALLCTVCIIVYVEYMSSIYSSRTAAVRNEELKMQNELYHLAYFDVLTGIENRASFEKSIEQIDRHPEHYRSLCLVFMDINNMKYINDTYGHYSGDKSLICVANALREIFKDGYARIYRIGGDEFCVICHNKSEIFIKIALGNLEAEIEKTRPYDELSIAVGYEFWDIDSGEELNTVFQNADRNMYKVKMEMKDNTHRFL
ncbi:MAG: GGDEF domain-containing protein [Clostridia bacterium]|nr:GGDEF domain-containing protein [Clostridia bacterium]